MSKSKYRNLFTTKRSYRIMMDRYDLVELA